MKCRSSVVVDRESTSNPRVLSSPRDWIPRSDFGKTRQDEMAFYRSGGIDDSQNQPGEECGISNWKHGNRLKSNVTISITKGLVQQ
jgi:hypothetical protein